MAENSTERLSKLQRRAAYLILQKDNGPELERVMAELSEDEQRAARQAVTDKIAERLRKLQRAMVQMTDVIAKARADFTQSHDAYIRDLGEYQALCQQYGLDADTGLLAVPELDRAEGV